MLTATAVPSDFNTSSSKANILNVLYLRACKYLLWGSFGLKLSHLISFPLSTGWFVSLQKFYKLHLCMQWSLPNMAVIFHPRIYKQANFQLYRRAPTSEILKLKSCELTTLQESNMLIWVENYYQIPVNP